MAVIALTTADKVNVGTSGPNVQHTAPAGAAITAGAPVIFNAAGRFVLSDADTAGSRGIFGIATHTAITGEALTVIRRGIMSGWTLDAVAYGAPVFLSDTAGSLDNVASVVASAHVAPVAIVIPVWGAQISGTPDKALLVDVIPAAVT